MVLFPLTLHINTLTCAMFTQALRHNAFEKDCGGLCIRPRLLRHVFN